MNNLIIWKCGYIITVLIIYGTSIALEMIIEGVVVVVPRYIDKNKTILEDKNVCVVIDSLCQLADFFDKYPDKTMLPDKIDIDNFIKDTIYGNNLSYEELMDKYTYFLE